MTDTRESMTQIKVSNEEKSPVKPEGKMEKFTNYLFGLMILMTCTGTTCMIQKMSELNQKLIDGNPSYEFPKFSDLKIAIAAMLILIVKYY